MLYRILGDIPNTYAFTKALGEALVADEMEKLPVIIVRPSIGKFLRNQTNLCWISVIVLLICNKRDNLSIYWQTFVEAGADVSWDV